MRASLGLLLLVVALVLAACGGAPAGGATGNTTEGEYGGRHRAGDRGLAAE
jgi:ABC-type glycerol-3-phosphate transport system substrate-binding protein